LFANYAILKFNGYYPVSTDISAYGIATWMLWAYLRNRAGTLAALTLAGAFVWPTHLYCGVLLLLFPRETQVAPTSRKPWETIGGIAMGAAAASAAAFVHYHFGIMDWGAKTMRSTVNLSICLLGLYLALATPSLIHAVMRGQIGWFCGWRRFDRLTIAIGLVVLSHAIQRWVSVPGTFEISPTLVFKCLLAIGIQKPLVFLLAHVLFFGPIILVAAFFWRQTYRNVEHVGRGLALVLGLGIVFSVGSESRQLMGYYPFLVPFIVLAMEQERLSRRFYLFFFGASLLASKAWCTVTVPGIATDEKYDQFPWQVWFSSIGYWINTEMYLIQGGLVLLATLFIYMEMSLENLSKKCGN
jgi:hypothetical protein